MKTAIMNMIAGLLMITTMGCDEGPVGPPGPPGNANVVGFNVVFSLDQAAFNGAVASQQFDVPELTPSVVDGGAVLVYFRDQGTWTAMPFTVGVESAEVAAVDYTFTLGFAYDDGFMEVFLEASTEDDVVWDDMLTLLPESYEMKVVVIDGFFLSKKADLDLRDYEAVKAYFGLKDG